MKVAFVGKNLFKWNCFTSEFFLFLLWKCPWPAKSSEESSASCIILSWLSARLDNEQLLGSNPAGGHRFMYFQITVNIFLFSRKKNRNLQTYKNVFRLSRLVFFKKCHFLVLKIRNISPATNKKVFKTIKFHLKYEKPKIVWNFDKTCWKKGLQLIFSKILVWFWVTVSIFSGPIYQTFLKKYSAVINCFPIITMKSWLKTQLVLNLLDVAEHSAKNSDFAIYLNWKLSTCGKVFSWENKDIVPRNKNPDCSKFHKVLLVWIYIDGQADVSL